MSREDLLSDLTVVLDTNRPALQTFQELLDVLEKDVFRTLGKMDSGGQRQLKASLRQVQGALERHRSLFYAHETRLAQLKHLYNVNPRDPRIQPLLMHFALVYASVEDRSWIIDQKKSDKLCERNVDGLLPYGITLFLASEAQMMLAKFLPKPTSWKEHAARVRAHQYWINAVVNGLLRGHALSYPLELLFIELGPMVETSSKQAAVEKSFQTLKEFQQQLPDIGQQRILQLELKHLASLCEPFPNQTKEVEE